MLKILLLTKNYPPQIGWIETYVVSLESQLLKQGNKVFIVKALPRNSFLFSIKQKNNFFLNLYRFSEIIRMLHFWIISFSVGLYYAFQSDVIWACDGSLCFIGFLLSKIFHKKFYATFHGTEIIWPNYIYQQIMPFFWNKADKAICVSLNTYNLLSSKIDNSRLFLNPHKLSDFSFLNPPLFDHYLFLNSFHIPADRIILFSIGRWVDRKWFHWFLKNIFSQLDNDKFFYVLAWQGSLEELYKQIIYDYGIKNVLLVGTINELQKAKFFLSSDFFVMPNIEIDGDVEGFGLVLLEAIYYNTACIISDADNLHLRIPPDNSAFILPAGDSDSWINFFNKL